MVRTPAIGTIARSSLLERLEARRSEIEETLLARVHSVSEPSVSIDPGYVEGLRAAVSAALTYGLSGVENVGNSQGSIPSELYAQARHAARNRVSLDTVLRRYFAGYTLLEDFLIKAAGEERLLQDEALRRMLRAQALRFDNLIAAIADEYEREATNRPASLQQRRAECVEKLLTGQLADPVELAYDFDDWHIGIVAGGPDAERTIRGLADGLDRRLLLLPKGGGMVWAWLGGRRKISAKMAADHAAQTWPAKASIAVGEPGRGLTGWRLSHSQASAAWPIALRGTEDVVCYGEVPLLASMIGDDVLASSLSVIYLAPLAKTRDGGAILRETLRAYFAAERNVSSAAAMLNLNRSTVTNRLNAIEKLLGRSLSSCSTEVEAALRLEELNRLGPVCISTSSRQCVA